MERAGIVPDPATYDDMLASALGDEVAAMGQVSPYMGEMAVIALAEAEQDVRDRLSPKA